MSSDKTHDRYGRPALSPSAAKVMAAFALPPRRGTTMSTTSKGKTTTRASVGDVMECALGNAIHALADQLAEKNPSDWTSIAHLRFVASDLLGTLQEELSN